LRIVMSSIMRRRNGLIACSVMGMLLSSSEVVETPHSQDRTPRRAIPFAALPPQAPYRASGLVLWHSAERRAGCKRRQLQCERGQRTYSCGGWSTGRRHRCGWRCAQGRVQAIPRAFLWPRSFQLMPSLDADTSQEGRGFGDCIPQSRPSFAQHYRDSDSQVSSRGSGGARGPGGSPALSLGRRLAKALRLASVRSPRSSASRSSETSNVVPLPSRALTSRAPR
jgi:hypothetical protein